MTKNVRETSLDAYFGEIEPDLNRRQKIVMAAFFRRNKPSSDREIADFLGNPINSITPRRNELADEELVKEAERGPCEITGRKVIKWELTDKGEEMAKDYAPDLEELMEE